MYKLYKIPDKYILKVILMLTVIFNLKYLFLIFQIPYTMMFVDFINQNEFYSKVSALKHYAAEITNFQDEGKIGFVSDTEQSSVFDLQDSIKAFYIVQYAVVPSILKNDTDETFVIGAFDKTVKIPDGFEIVKKIDEKTFILKRINQ